MVHNFLYSHTTPIVMVDELEWQQQQTKVSYIILKYTNTTDLLIQYTHYIHFTDCNYLHLTI